MAYWIGLDRGGIQASGKPVKIIFVTTGHRPATGSDVPVIQRENERIKVRKRLGR
jgi:hypothetical protein